MMKPSVVSRYGVVSSPLAREVTTTTTACNCNYNITQGACEHNMFSNVESNNNVYSSDDLDTPSDDSDISSKMLDQASSDIDVDSDSLSLNNGQEMDEEDESKKNDLATVFQGEWPINKTYWSEDGDNHASSIEAVMQHDTRSIMSFDSSMTCSSMTNQASMTAGDPSTVKDDVMLRSTLVSLLQNDDKVEVTRILLEMSSSPENCIAMIEPGSQCLPLLVQLIHDRSEKQTFMAYRQSVRLRATAVQILHNIVFSQPDDKKGRRETRVLKLLEQVRSYSDYLQNSSYEVNDNRNDKCSDQQLGPTVAALMKLSFDEDHRHAMCLLGGLQALAELIEIDQEVHGCSGDQYCTMIRRYSGMALTNLTFGDGANKALLCSMKPFMLALVAQLQSPSEELRQVSASVLRNLSWRADKPSKKMLREVGAVTTLMRAAMEASKESTLKSILSALWNLSAHCSENKADLCEMEGALGFLVNTLSYKSGSKNLAVVENCGGILRNVSSHIALENDYRAVLRKHNCLQILLHHLRSPSLTVVSNACGTLWNLSARNAQDQRALWEMGAVGMLKKLMNSKHKMISMGSSAALKNLLSAMPANMDGELNTLTSSDYNNGMPSLHVRKQKLLNAEIDQNLSETFDNTDVSLSSPTKEPRSRKSSFSRSRAISLPRQGIPQRIDAKKRNVSETRTDNASDKVTNILDDGINYSSVNIAQTTPQSSPRKISVPTSVIKNRDGFGNQRYTNHKNVPCPPNNSIKETVTMRVSSPGNVRPYSFPSRYDRSSIRSSSPPLTSSTRPMAGKQARTIGQQPQGIRPPGDRAYYNNLINKTKNVHHEDDTKQNYPSNDGSVCLDEATDESDKKSKIPTPKLNNYIDDTPQQLNQTTIPHGLVTPKGIPRAPSLQKRALSSESPEQQRPTRNTGYPDDVQTAQSYAKAAPQKLFSVRNDVDRSLLQKRRSLHSSPSCSLSDLSQGGAAAAGGTPLQPQVHALSKTYEVSPRNFNRSETGGTISRNSVPDKNSDFMQKKLRYPEKKRTEPQRRNETPVKDTKANAEDTIGNRFRDTPLMFSRSSSLGSISSVEQQQDDNSPVSEFSHQTSDGVSPSDLPDSPSQPMLPTTAAAYGSDAKQNLARVNVATESELQAKNARKQPSVINRINPTASDASREEEKIYQRNTIIPTKVSTEKRLILQDRRHSNDDVVVDRSRNVTQHLNDLKHQARSNICPPTVDTSVKPVASNFDRMIKPPKSYRKPISSKPPKKPDETEIEDYEQQIQKPKTSSVQRNVCSDEEQKTIAKYSEISQGFGTNSSSNNVYAENVPDKLGKPSFILTNFVQEKSKSLVKSKQDDLDSANLSDSGHNFEKETEVEDLSASGSCLHDGTSSSKSNSPAKLSSNKTLYTRLPTFSPKKQVHSEKRAPAKLIPSEHQQCGVNNELSIDREANRTSSQQSSLRSPEKLAKSSSIPSATQYLTYRKHAGPPRIQATANEVSGINHRGTENDVSDEPETKISEISRVKSDSENLDPKGSNDGGGSKTQQASNRPSLTTTKDQKETNLVPEISVEAQKITDEMLEAVVDSTDDMTVSTLSCLSDIDNMQPPSIMAELECLSLTNNGYELDKTKCIKGSPSNQKSLLKKLQISRLSREQNDLANCRMSGSTGSLNMDSSGTSDILENINPPSMLDDISFTGSTGSLNSLPSNILDEKVVMYTSDENSMNERLCEAAAMVQMYAKEFSNITGNHDPNSGSDGNNTISTNTPPPQSIHPPLDILDDATERCDTIASDVEFADDLPCDDEELGSETLLAPRYPSSLTKEEQGDGSTENLTVTLTEENPKLKHGNDEDDQDEEDDDQYQALRENADLILNSLKRIHLSENSEFGGLPANDMLEDETLSLVSNDSDEDFLSAENVFQ